MISLIDAAMNIQKFENGSLTGKISDCENFFRGKDKIACNLAFPKMGIETSLLESAFTIKRTVGQINVVIHSIGILLSLPHILEDGETVETLSLGAGNTGRSFDLETNKRVAEFKFINWKGGAESIRQNSLFKDFFMLAECDLPKRRYLYVIGTEHPLRFFNSNRALSSVMSKNIKLWKEFNNKYPGRFEKVNEYYAFKKTEVELVDISTIISEFCNVS